MGGQNSNTPIMLTIESVSHTFWIAYMQNQQQHEYFKQSFVTAICWFANPDLHSNDTFVKAFGISATSPYRATDEDQLERAMFCIGMVCGNDIIKKLRAIGEFKEYFGL